MTYLETLREVTRLAVELRAEGGRLRFRPPDRVTPELLAALREHKAALIVYLAPDHEPSFEERAAVGFINPGWRASEWEKRLWFMAGSCHELNPKAAGLYRQWARMVRLRIELGTLA